jgi:hypothetical protein
VRAPRKGRSLKEIEWREMALEMNTARANAAVVRGERQRLIGN